MTREVITKFSEKDYHIFTRIVNGSGLSVQEKIQETVDMYLLIERDKFAQSRVN